MMFMLAHAMQYRTESQMGDCGDIQTNDGGGLFTFDNDMSQWYVTFRFFCQVNHQISEMCYCVVK